MKETPNSSWDVSREPVFPLVVPPWDVARETVDTGVDNVESLTVVKSIQRNILSEISLDKTHMFSFISCIFV